MYRGGHRGHHRRTKDKESDAASGREALGRARGGLTSKIHLAADSRCRPISRVTTGGHRHDSLTFDTVMAGIRRNVVERAINKLKGYRAVATRYDKRDFVFRGTIDVASIRIWLREPVP